MIRSWGLVTLTGSAQPCFSDVTTAAVGLAAGDGSIPVTVASTTRYRAGDRIILNPGQSDADTVIVQYINSATVLTCYSEDGVTTNTHISGTIIALSIACSEILLTSQVGNAGTAWIGSDSTVTNAGAGSAFTYMSAGGFYNLGSPTWNMLRSTEAWMAGTASDKVGVAAIVI